MAIMNLELILHKQQINDYFFWHRVIRYNRLYQSNIHFENSLEKVKTRTTNSLDQGQLSTLRFKYTVDDRRLNISTFLFHVHINKESYEELIPYSVLHYSFDASSRRDVRRDSLI